MGSHLSRCVHVFFLIIVLFFLVEITGSQTSCKILQIIPPRLLMFQELLPSRLLTDGGRFHFVLCEPRVRSGRVVGIVGDGEGGSKAVRQLLQPRPGGGRGAAHHGVAGGVARQTRWRSENRAIRTNGKAQLVLIAGCYIGSLISGAQIYVHIQ